MLKFSFLHRRFCIVWTLSTIKYFNRLDLNIIDLFIVCSHTCVVISSVEKSGTESSKFDAGVIFAGFLVINDGRRRLKHPYPNILHSQEYKILPSFICQTHYLFVKVLLLLWSGPAEHLQVCEQ